MRYNAFHDHLIDSVLAKDAHTPQALRRAVLERGKHPGGPAGDVPEALTHYVDTVARHAYKVTDADVAKLKQAGQSDDALFEITVVAAVGAAMHRLERGLAALEGREPD
jgi:alkylhydroperoxidase family enzyme